MDALKNIARSAGGLAVGLIGAKIIGLLYRILIARLSPEEYGLYSLGLVTLGIGSLIASAGLLTGVVRYISFYRGKGDDGEVGRVISTAMKTTICLGVIIAVLLWIFSSSIAVLVFKNEKLGMVIKAFAIVIPFYTLTEVFVSITEAYKTIKYRVLTTHFYTNLIKLAFTFILILVGYRLMGAIAAFIIATVTACWISYRFMRKLYKQKIDLLNLKVHKELYKFSWPLFLSKFLNSVYEWTDSFVLGILIGTVSVGIYNAALPLASMLEIIPTSILAIYLPTISEMYARKESIKVVYKTVTRWILILSAPITALLIVFSSEIISFAFGSEYGPAAFPLVILSGGFFIFSILKPSGYLLSVYKLTKIVFCINILATVTNLVLNLILIPKYQLIGAATATASVYVISSVLAFMISLKKEKTFPMDVKSLRIFLIVAVLGSITFYINKVFTFSILHVIIISIIFLVCYMILINLLRCLTKQDLKIVFDLFKAKS